MYQKVIIYHEQITIIDTILRIAHYKKQILHGYKKQNKKNIIKNHAKKIHKKNCLYSNFSYFNK